MEVEKCVNCSNLSNEWGRNKTKISALEINRVYEKHEDKIKGYRTVLRQ